MIAASFTISYNSEATMRGHFVVMQHHRQQREPRRPTRIVAFCHTVEEAFNIDEEGDIQKHDDVSIFCRFSAYLFMNESLQLNGNASQVHGPLSHSCVLYTRGGGRTKTGLFIKFPPR